MSEYAGVLKVLRFNWPWYAGALSATVIGLCLLRWWIPSGSWSTLALVTIGLGNAWLLLSLVVSHVVYDRSRVAGGGWLDVGTQGSVVVLHAGHDEASAHVRKRLPAAACVAFDFFDPVLCTSPSLMRARATNTTETLAMPLSRIPLPDASADLALVVFAGHEIRDDGARVGFFRDVSRIIGARGRVVVVEHQRDAWNLLAYGPGFLHFLSRRTWLRTFAEAGLEMERDECLTPWVHRFSLRIA